MQKVNLNKLGKVLITGASGFVGSSLVKKLVKNGLNVRAMDNNIRGNVKRLKSVMSNIEFIEGDVTSLDDCIKSAKGIDTLIHLAAINGTENFYKIPDKVLEVGIMGAFNTIKASKLCGVKNYLVTSSSEVYQEPTKIPTDESERMIIPDINNPRFSYSISKIVSEAVVLNNKSKGLKKIICRPHNFYGPDMGLAHVIPQFILRMKELSNNFRINSIDFPIQGTGKETRSFCYIDDGLNGLIQSILNGKDREIYHIGTQKEFKIEQIAKLIAKLLNLDLNITYGEKLHGSTSKRCPDIGKISKIGYKPQYEIEQGLKHTIDWYLNEEIEKNNGNIIR